MNLKKQRTVLKGFNFLNNLVGKNRQNTFSGLIRNIKQDFKWQSYINRHA